ncbi:MAG: hypothetical protein E6Q97_10710 [Desulfurellales bacterium]|nr:MAG: hypothetical protein E6Q97_10710 [Desulfurellales bacterium]
MSTHRDVNSLNAAIRRRIASKIEQAVEIIDDMAKDTYNDAVELTSGTATIAQLREENHPYGRGFNAPNGKRRAQRKALPINKHSGKLQESFRNVRRDMRTGRFSRVAEFRLETHGVSYSKYVIRRSPKDKSKMIYRGFWEELDHRRKMRLYKMRQEFRRRPSVA